MNLVHDILWILRCVLELVLIVVSIKLIIAYTLKTEER